MKRASWLWWALTLSTILATAKPSPWTNTQADRVLTFTSRDFRNYASRKREDLTLAILITASTSRCEYCGMASEMFRQGLKKLKKKSSKGEDLIIRDGEGRGIIFAEIDVLNNLEVGQMLQLQDVPHLYVLNSKNFNCSFPTDSSEPALCTVKGNDLLVKNASAGVNEQYESLLKALGRDDLWQKHFKPIRVFTRRRVAAGLITLSLCMIPILPQIAKILNKNMWIVGTLSTIIYGIATSGIIYNWQNNAWKLFGTDRFGRRSFIHASSRSQYLGEGLIFAFSNVIISAVLYLTARILNKPKKDVKSIVMTTFMIISLGCLYTQICKHVHDKVAYIMYPLLPPDNTYSTGGPRRDKRFTT